MLKAENFPPPTVKEAAEAGGVSDRTVRTAKTLRKKDPDLAAKVSKGHITLNAATEIANTPPSAERQQVIEEVSEAANKKQAKRVVRRRKAENSRQRDFGNLRMPGLSGPYNTLLAVIGNLQKLPQELRELENAPHRLSKRMALTLKVAVEGLRKLDFDELLVAADTAIKELDRVIKGGAPDEAPTDNAGEGTDAADHSAATWGTRIGGFFRGGN
jgi:hypothetical protein